jgi:very-short-patch-repair endonuclease
MACWPDAASSHETALFLPGLIPPSAGPPHVTAIEPRKARCGLIAYRAKLPPEDITCTNGVPVTTLARTFLDVAPRHEPAWVRRLIKDAEFRKLLTIPDLVAVLERHPNWRGRRALAAIVAPLIDDSRPTRSELEDRFLAFCRRRKLPLPETNARLVINGRRYEPDALWRAARVIVELDGRDAHTRELAFHEDRARDRTLIAAGWIPIRVTSGQLDHEGDAVEADLRLILSHRGRRGIARPGAG